VSAPDDIEPLHHEPTSVERASIATERLSPAADPRVATASDAPVVVRVPSWMAWASAAAVLLPLNVLLPELSQYFAAKSFGFPGARFGATSVSAGDASAAPAWQRAMQAGIGPLVTWVVVALSCLLVRRPASSRVAVVAGLTALGRPIIMSVAFLLALAFPSRMALSAVDELSAVRALGISPLFAMLVTIALTVAAGTYLARRLPAGRRRRTLGVIAGGGVAGLLVYMAIVGTLLG
jgi:hypothetical protein